MTNADKFKSIFGLYATKLWSLPEKDFLKWLNSEAMNCSEFPNNSDTISRQAAIDVASRECHEWRGIFSDIEHGLKELPSVQPETQKILDDGTLIVHTDIDIIKITRVIIAQNNTHYGDLFYRDEE